MIGFGVGDTKVPPEGFPRDSPHVLTVPLKAISVSYNPIFIFTIGVAASVFLLQTTH